MDLKEITRPVLEELKDFDYRFREAMRSRVALVDMIARYIVKRKGKRIRPALVLLAAKACGDLNDSSYRGASLVEILHTATLIHDDVVDDSDKRRGFPSINAVWKNKIAVLMGDYLLAKGLLLSLDNNDFHFLKIISDAVRRMSEAEILQIKKSRDLDVNEQTYLKIISDKTASLFATCCEIGAASVSNDVEVQRRLKNFGENLGMVFQIRDDLFDYTGHRGITGKPIGLDMKGKKLTLPLIHSLENAPRKKSKEVLSMIKKGVKKKDIQIIIEFVQEYGGIEYTLKKAKEFSALAIEELQMITDSESKTALMQFVEFVLERNK